jgi:hypothetical protein
MLISYKLSEIKNETEKCGQKLVPKRTFRLRRQSGVGPESDGARLGPGAFGRTLPDLCRRPIVGSAGLHGFSWFVFRNL